MFCSNCGKEIRDDSIFCEFCGSDLSLYKEMTDTSNPSSAKVNADFAPSEVSVQSSQTISAEQDKKAMFDLLDETESKEKMVAEEETKKKSNVKKIFVTIAAVVVCIAALILIPKNSSKKQEKNTLFSEGLLPVCIDDEYGYVNEKGEFVIEPQFGMAFNFASDGLARVRNDLGYINKKGEYVVDPNVDSGILYFTDFDKNGLAAIRCVDDLAGHINKDGEFIYEPVYIDVGEFADNGLAWAAYGGKCYVYINTRGEVVHGFYEWPGEYMDNGLVWVKELADDYYNNWALLDEKGTVLARGFEEVGEFGENGLAAVADRNGLYGYINEKGEIVIELQFHMAEAFESNGLARVVVCDEDTNEEKYGFINEKGEVVIEPVYTKAGKFAENGLASVSEGDEYGYGYINEKGKYVIEPQFELAGAFADGMARVVVDGMMGCINEKGKFVIEPKFEAIDTFSNGLAKAKWGDWDVWGYIDEKGEVVVEPYFTGAGEFYDDGYAIVECAGRYGVINRDGDFILEPIYEYIRTD